MSQAPQPAPAEADDGDEDDAPEPEEEALQEAAGERMDELDEAEVETADGEVTDDPFDGTEEAEDEVDIDLADVDVGEDVDDGGGEPFDGTEEATSESAYDGTSGSTGTSDAGGDFGGMDEMAGMAGENIAETINEGFARAAVVGLPEQFEHNGEVKSKSDLEDEFVEVFETFKLGKNGGKVAEEYLDFEGEVDPIWGFTASLVICAVFTAQMRPDSDELVEKLAQRLGGGLDG